jgi:hypothetical protein
MKFCKKLNHREVLREEYSIYPNLIDFSYSRYRFEICTNLIPAENGQEVDNRER